MFSFFHFSLYLFFHLEKMMIDEAIAEVVTTLPDDKQILLSDRFQLHIDNQVYQDVKTDLYKNCIILTLKKMVDITLLRIDFTFDLIFQFLRIDENGMETLKVTGEPCSIKFQRFNKTLLLRSSVPNQNLIVWRNYLQKKLNQRGFHELFKPIKKIGKGNFAAVYLVVRHEDGKKYAVKAFSKEGTFSEEKGKQSLINQIQVMRQFGHKNLMKLFGVFQSQNSIYVAVQLLEGGQLYDKIKYRHKFVSAEIKMIMKGILQGLEVMHSHNIMHRDLKPQNILLRKENDYDCVIADFGLAQHCENDPYLFVRCGTPGYVAPEVVNLKDLKAKYHPICDLFSVGVIFHLLALRKPPFPGKEYDEVLSQNRACKINFSAPEYQQLPESWIDLMKKLLEKEPSQRITATNALNHEFFSKDNLFAEFNKERSSMQRQAILKQDMANECQSPLMMTKNNARKNPGLLKNDSCLKFKMKQNLLTGRTDESGQIVDEIDSPGLKKRPLPRNPGVESRFKRLAKQ